MAKRIFTRIQSFLSYKYFDRKSREYWQGRWKRRNKKDSARGWNNSPEFYAYRASIKPRLIKYAERNPAQFFEKKDTVLRYSKVDYSDTFVFGGKAELVTSFLNPMRGKWGLTHFLEQMQLRAILARKQFLPIARVRMAPGLDEESEPGADDNPSILPLNEEGVPVDSVIVTSIAESNRLRGQILKRYGEIIARDKETGKDKEKGEYDRMGANYKVEIISTSTIQLVLIDMEIFYY